MKRLIKFESVDGLSLYEHRDMRGRGFPDRIDRIGTASVQFAAPFIGMEQPKISVIRRSYHYNGQYHHPQTGALILDYREKL